MFENYNKFVAEIKKTYNEAKVMDGEVDGKIGRKSIDLEYMTRGKQKNEEADCD